MVSLFELVNAAIILAFSSSLILLNFVGLSLNHTPHIIIKSIVICGARQPNVRGDVVTEIFSQPRLASPACVVWCRVLLPDVESSNNHPLDLGKDYLFQARCRPLC